jgi:hypothetical protein
MELRSVGASQNDLFFCLTDFFSLFYFAHFYYQIFAPIGLQKTNTASGRLVQKISQRQLL